jgi:hypothetical protein
MILEHLKYANVRILSYMYESLTYSSELYVSTRLVSVSICKSKPFLSKTIYFEREEEE